MFSHKLKYGLQALVYLSTLKRNEIVSAATFSSELKIPKEFVSKILQSLTKTGLVDSKKGKGGGFFLSVEPDQIKLSYIIDALGGHLNSECLFGLNKLCKNDDCEVCKEWKDYNNKFNNLINRYTLGDFSHDHQ